MEELQVTVPESEINYSLSARMSANPGYAAYRRREREGMRACDSKCGMQGWMKKISGDSVLGLQLWSTRCCGVTCVC